MPTRIKRAKSASPNRRFRRADHEPRDTFGDFSYSAPVPKTDTGYGSQLSVCVRLARFGTCNSCLTAMTHATHVPAPPAQRRLPQALGVGFGSHWARQFLWFQCCFARPTSCSSRCYSRSRSCRNDAWPTTSATSATTATIATATTFAQQQQAQQQ